MSNKSIQFAKPDIEKINIFLIPGLSKKIDESFENVKEYSAHPEHIHIVEEFCDFSDDLNYTARVYGFDELSKLGALLNRIFTEVAAKRIALNSELIKIINSVLTELKKWTDAKGETSAQLKKFIADITTKTDDALKFAALSKKKKEEDKEIDKVVPVSSSELRQLKESIYDLYTNFSFLSKTIDTNLPDRYLKKKWYQDFKNIERAFTANLTNLQKEYFSFRRMEIKSMLQDIEFEIRTFAMKNNRSIKIKIDGSDIKMDVYCIEKVYQILIELLKNSVEHSFKNKDNEQSGGQNIISINFSNESGNIFIEITDNGAGFDSEKIIEKAKKRGIINENEIENINEIFFNVLLCSPHLSEKGRGNGLKAVKSNIDKLNGNIRFKARDTKGSNIFIDIPLFKKIV